MPLWLLTAFIAVEEVATADLFKIIALDAMDVTRTEVDVVGSNLEDVEDKRKLLLDMTLLLLMLMVPQLKNMVPLQMMLMALLLKALLTMSMMTTVAVLLLLMLMVPLLKNMVLLLTMPMVLQLLMPMVPLLLMPMVLLRDLLIMMTTVLMFL